MYKLAFIALLISFQYSFAECFSELNREDLVTRFNSGELVFKLPFKHKFKLPDLEGELEIMSDDLSNIRVSSTESLEMLKEDDANKWTATVNDDRAKLIYAADDESNYRKWLFVKSDDCWYLNGFFEGTS